LATVQVVGTFQEHAIGRITMAYALVKCCTVIHDD
jgi:hypothetical protein